MPIYSYKKENVFNGHIQETIFYLKGINYMLYPKKNEKELSLALFENPTAEYRAAPFWAWNCDLDHELLKKEIDSMKEMGFGGYYMHPRVGLSTKYLSEDFMSYVNTCILQSKKNDMLSYLYDEDKWPSGFAGGLNTKDIENRQKSLFLTTVPYNDENLVTEHDKSIATDKLPESKYKFIASFDVLLNNEYKIVSYRRTDISEDVPEGHTKLFSYLEYTAPSPYFNNQAYCDTLQKSVIESFIKITHEAYKNKYGDEFGKTIPAIFTDEPQFRFKKQIDFAGGKVNAVMPYTTDFKDTFFKTYGKDIEDHFPVLIWENADGVPSQIRYFFHDHIAERFTSSFCDTVGKWCEENNIAMTGHVMNESSLTSQTSSVGDAMRCYCGFTVPGIDMLCDNRELTTAKQAQSASHQYGREGVTSELYGVTNWNFDFRGHKLQGDWQAALGVTCRVPHLFWVSMRGEAKRDYPASIGYQSPWYKEYKHIEDHFARVNTVMTRGTPEVKIGVIHPVESAWLHYGPIDQTKRTLSDLDNRFSDLTEMLLNGLFDFDFICESLLPSQYKETEKGFAIGHMTYNTVIVPALETMRSTTLNALKKFRKNGGRILFIGEAPLYLDALPSDEPRKFAEECEIIPWVRGKIYEALKEDKFIDIKDFSGNLSWGLIHQVRNDGEFKHIFISHVYKPKNYDVAPIESFTITIKGEWTVHEYDTLKGEKRRLKVSYKKGATVFNWICSKDSSLLLELKNGRDTEEGGFEFIDKIYSKAEYPAHFADFTLSEPNVLLLDRPEYKINGGEWNDALNIIKADEIIRRATGGHLHGAKMAQPWIEPLDKDPKDKVTLRYTFDSDIEYEGAHIAIEAPEYTELVFNGENVKMNVDGYYIDEESIKTIKLPKIKKGTNELIANIRVGDITPLESYYILGNFGVENYGIYSKITDLPEKLYFDSITTQRLPFYGGNVKYSFKFNGGGKKTVEISKYRGAVIKAFLDGKALGYVDFPPHRLYLGELSDGEHTLELELFGTRINTLGQLHNTNDNIPWAGSVSWRTTGRFWTDEYMLYPQGIMTAPRILTEE